MVHEGKKLFISINISCCCTEPGPALGDAGVLLDPGPALEESSILWRGDTSGHRPCGLWNWRSPVEVVGAMHGECGKASWRRLSCLFNCARKGQSDSGRRGKQRPRGLTTAYELGKCKRSGGSSRSSRG